ncbi:alpha/beta hydrolase, partial [Saccharomonospora iraqiensis]|uniref:alpha/beta hydrolase n=1 Tax=Saccharomonospora iraqiensis TaxID=52698 RepID=UPI0006963D5B
AGDGAGDRVGDAAGEAGSASFRPARTPVIFVHGQQGSAQQWQSNAKRFSVNGYPDRLLHAYEYDTTVADNAHAVQGLRELVTEVRGRTGARAVDVIAHSRGTAVLHEYLSAPARAAGIRRYVNIDGRSAEAPPGGVPTLALWASVRPDGEIGGAVNVRLPELGHTEAAVSAESFGIIHRFLTGRPPWTTEVLPEPPGRVHISGRVTFFPRNAGARGRLEVWPVDPDTGRRLGDRPRHVVRTGRDGGFGPLRVHGLRRYELVFVRDGELTYHFYPETFRRSDHFVRLQVSEPGGITDRIDRCPGHTALTVTRNREWWADQGGGDDDALLVDGENVLAPAVAPKARQVIAAFVFDAECDTVSRSGEAVPPFDRVPFLTAVDRYVPAGAGEPVSVTQVARGSGGATRTITVRDWASDRHAVTVQFHDHLARTVGRGRE